jgi:hypothetical protein
MADSEPGFEADIKAVASRPAQSMSFAFDLYSSLESLLSRFTDAQGRRVRSHPPSAIPGAP